MIYVSDEFKEAFFGAGQKTLTLTFDDGTVIDNEDIALETMELEQTLCDSDELKFGKVASACFKTKITVTTKRFKNLWFDAKIGVGEHEIQLGRFKVYSDNMTSDQLYRDIVAYDALFWANNTDLTEWYNELTFPISQKDFRDSLFDYLRIEQEEVELPNDTLMIKKADDQEEITGLTVLQALCEMNATWGVVNYEGKFKYVRMRTIKQDVLYPSPNLYPSEDLFPDGDIADEVLTKSDYYLRTLTYEEFDVLPITKIIIRQNETDRTAITGQDGNTYVIENNLLLYNATVDSLSKVIKNFFEYAKYISYTPSSVSRKGAPWMEVGDLLRIIADKKILYVPILVRKLSGISALKDTYTARGNELYGERINGSIKRFQIKFDVFDRNFSNYKANTDGKIETLSSSVSQNTTELDLKAPKTDIVSIINESKEEIVLKGNRVVIESDNWTVNADGSQTCKNMNIEGGNVVLTSEEDVSNFKIFATDGETHMQCTPAGIFFRKNSEETIAPTYLSRVLGLYVSEEISGTKYISRVKGHTSSFNWVNIEHLTVKGTTYLASSPVITSDRDLKKDIAELDNPSEFVYSLKPCKYKFVDGTSDRYHHGFIAQEVKESMGDEDWGVYVERETEDGSYKALRYEELIADLVATVQEQNERIKALEERIGE